MAYQLSVNQRSTYLHIIITGRNSRETVTQYLEELRKECIARNCFRVLIEERLEGPRLGTIDVFRIVSEESKKTAALLDAIAYVDVNAEGNLMQFAETVAVNRGVRMTLFSCVADAEKWLMNSGGGAKPHRAPDVE